MSDPNEWNHTIKNFQRKKNDLQAIRLTSDNSREVAKWCGGESVVEEGEAQGYLRPTRNTILLHVPHLNGVLDGYHGDWVVKDEDGRFAVYPNEVFIAEYEVKKSE